MEFRKDSEVADWALAGAKPLVRPLQTWEREALRRKRRSLMRAATEMESMAMSGTASPKMAKAREETARKYRDQIAELEKVMARFKILEGRKMRVTKRQLQRIIKEEKARLISERNFNDRLERVVVSVLEDTLDLPGMDSNPEAAAQTVRNRVDQILDQAVKGLLQTMDDDFDPDRPY